MCSRQTSLNICVLLWGNADRGYGQRFHSKKVLDLLRLVSGFAKEKKYLWGFFLKKGMHFLRIFLNNDKIGISVHVLNSLAIRFRMAEIMLLPVMF